MYRVVLLRNTVGSGLRLYSAAATTGGKNIGFIGLGNMGAHMARNLIKAGHNLVVFDLSADATKSLAEAGAKVCVCAS